MKSAPTISDEQLRTMLVLHAGPAMPAAGAARARRHATRRTLGVALCLAALCGAAVPASQALLGASPEPPRQFVADPAQPANARLAIQRYLDQTQPFQPALSTVTPLLTAEAPDGTYGVYGLTFADGSIGTAVISEATDGVATFASGESLDCPPGWSLEAGESFVAYPGRTPLYLVGRVSSRVAAVDVVYPDGHSTAAAIGNGRFLAWAEPIAGEPTPVDVVARDASGAQVGELHVDPQGGIPRQPGQANDAPSCG